jgi:hypothetical protein
MEVHNLNLWVLRIAAVKRFKRGDRLAPVPDAIDAPHEVYHEEPTGINKGGTGGLS